MDTVVVVGVVGVVLIRSYPKRTVSSGLLNSPNPDVVHLLFVVE